MTHQERLRYCKICTNRKFESQLGIICGIINQRAAFEKECENFSIDNEEALKVAERQKALEETEAEGGFFGPEKKGMKKGVVGGIVMLAIALVWFIVGWTAGYIFYYPPILAVIGIVAIVKGAAEGNLAGEKYKRTQ